MGAEILTASFVVVVIGGLGSFWGVVWAALIVGVVRGLTVYFYPAAAEASMYLLMLLGAAVPSARALRRAHPALRMSEGCCAPLSLIAALAMAVLPFALLAGGLTLTSATDVVIFAVACMALNILVGHTGLVSFGHGAWFGLGAYAAALTQKYWFPGSVLWPALVALAFLLFAAAIRIGFLVLRRRGVYFSLLTLAFSALTYAVAFRWTAFTGGESGLGGVTRASWLGVDLENPLGLLRFGRGVRARRRVRARSAFTPRRSAPCWSRSARTSSARSSSAMRPIATSRSRTSSRRSLTGCAGVLFAFHHRFASADPTVDLVLRRAARDGDHRRHAQPARARRWARCSTSCSANTCRSGRRTGCCTSACCSSPSSCSRRPDWSASGGG